MTARKVKKAQKKKIGSAKKIRKAIRPVKKRNGRKQRIDIRRRHAIKKNLVLHKFGANPIIAPRAEQRWESQYVFNPAAVYDDGKVNLIYRAIGDSGVSVFGYASSRDGLYIDERLNQPVFAPRELLEKENKEQVIVYTSNSGGSWGGCEDPRATKLEDRIYITYTAFNSYPRVALTSIKREDFLRKRWRWREPVYISPPGEVHKNWVIFPEKIEGKYAILHCISPDIQIAYVDSLDFDGKTFIKSHCPNGGVRKGVWDSHVRGAGPPPIKTDAGWLLIYHAIDDRDPGKYKMGAMLLDLENPEKILHRSIAPILEPKDVYENYGFKPGIVYSCGAVVIGEKLFVYYGAADTVACAATADLKNFLEALKKGDSVKLEKTKILS